MASKFSTILPASTEQANTEAYIYTMGIELTDIRAQAAEWERLNDMVVAVMSARYEARVEAETRNTVPARKNK